MLLEGRDALVVAPTGGGKTGAFLVPALHLAIRSRGKRKTLVAAPTRELVAQLAREARRWLGLCGSDLAVATPPFTDAKAALCVATPQALLQSKISPALLVLDEADRLLDTEGGLLKAVDALLALGATATRALVSATAPGPFMEAAVAALAPTRCVVRVGDRVRRAEGHRGAALRVHGRRRPQQGARAARADPGWGLRAAVRDCAEINQCVGLAD